MGGLLVAVFDDEGGAHRGADALRALHAEGTVTLYASAIVARGARGAGVAVREPMAEGAGTAAPVVGAAVGALVTLLGGPLAAVGRTIDGALAGAVRDLAEAGLDGSILERVSRRLQPGGGAVLGHVEEEAPLPVDSRVAALGGRVLRHGLVGTAPEERIAREAAALRAALAGLREDRLGTTAAPAAVRAMRRTRAAEFRRALARAEALARALRCEAVAKVAVLRAQAAGLDGAARLAVENRAGAVRAELEARAARLDRLVEDLAWPAGHGPRPGAPRGCDF
jgi:uncharacterized membrane protein